MRTQNLFLIGTLVLLDAAMVLAGWLLAYQVRVAGDILPYYYTANPEHYRNTVLISLPLWILIFGLCRLYDREELLGGPQEYGNVVKACLIGFAALIAVSIFMRTPELARGWLLIGLVVTTMMVSSARFVLRRIFYALRGRGWFIQRALIVGTNDDARAIARQLSPATRTGVNVVGFVDEYLPVNTPVENFRVLATTSNMHDITREQKIDQVILVSGAMAWETFAELLRGITLTRDETYAIKLSPGLYETLTTGVRVSYKNRVPLLAIDRAPIAGIDALLKGGLDFTVGWAAFLITLPVMALIALCLVILGRRPIVERHTVWGQNGASFETLLFASERPFSEKWKRGHRFGKFLYDSGLEKLPQLRDVLRGKMSLVGPRPLDPRDAETLQEWLPNLLSLKPGLTGARASSALNVITLEQEMRLELYYARNYSIWLDLQIIFQTLMRIAKRERVMRENMPEPQTRPAHWSVTALTSNR